MRKKSLDTLKKENDKMWSTIIRGAGECAKCKSGNRLQAAHIVSRSWINTRWNLENGVCLCSGCHLYWAHKEPDEWVDWLRQEYGEDIHQRLREKASRVTYRTSNQRREFYEEANRSLKEIYDRID